MDCDDIELEDLNQIPLISNVDENKLENFSDDVENVSTVNTDICFDTLSFGLQIKPNYWTDEYWETFISTYKWFVHKDGNVGCSICMVNRVFLGKRSLLANMKLQLFELIYSDFERKLSEHIYIS